MPPRGIQTDYGECLGLPNLNEVVGCMKERCAQETQEMNLDCFPSSGAQRPECGARVVKMLSVCVLNLTGQESVQP